MRKLKFRLADRSIETDNSAFVMGIVNVTPDSFWKESRGGLAHALQLIDEGADLLDIGGESSRPGSAYVSAEEEIQRIIPVISNIRKYSSIPLSVDTRKKEVMKAAYEAGADILNDISAGEDDPLLFSFAAETHIPVIVMHKRGTPDTMQNNTGYTDIFSEVDDYLKQRCACAAAAGIHPDKIIVDPGIGFGKNCADNMQLIRKCGMLCDKKYPVLMALSRKTCIGDITGKDIPDRLAGTLAADLLAVQYGAFMIRVHDVGPAVDSLKILRAINSGDE